MSLKNWFSRWNTRVWAATTPRTPEFVGLAASNTGPAPESLFEFTAWPKTARLLRDIVITEKLDGTNAAILIQRVGADRLLDHLATRDPEILGYTPAEFAGLDGDPLAYWVVGAQSRNRVISLSADNQGFAKWVQKHARTLVEDLGEGRHFGEFWGNKIGRGYGLPDGDRRFSLFNPETLSSRVNLDNGGTITVSDDVATPGLGSVPVLYSGEFRMDMIRATLEQLQDHGSQAVPGFMKPEGIVVYHTHARKVIGKVTLDNQDAGKWEA